MALCVTLLIAAEFMPVSLLTPIANDLHATAGMAGQAISISGLFAVVTSLLIATVAARFDRRHVLLALTAIMLVSLVLIALAPNFAVLMVARALLGVVIGGFWSLATATVMGLVPEHAVPKALGTVHMGGAVAAAFAAPIGSYLGGGIGWRGVFWMMVPLTLATMAWQWVALPSMPPRAASPVGKLFVLLKRRDFALGMLAQMLIYGGAFMAFTYFRPFLETRTGVGVTQLSFLLLALGMAGFVGTAGATKFVGRHLYLLLGGLPLAMALATVGLLAVQHSIWAVGAILIVWGALNPAVSVCWSTWLSKSAADAPESGGGLMVGCIQLAIMLGAGVGGVLLDHLSVTATFIGGAVLLLAAFALVGNGRRLRPGSTPNPSDEVTVAAPAFI